jgi:UDP-N-acetylglucosamine:LPS N-acetylglucosamine transferase
MATPLDQTALPDERRRVRVVAVASAGGHFTQLFRLRPAWDGCEVTYVTTIGGYEADVVADAAERGEARPGYVVVPDANRWQKLRVLYLAVRLAVLVVRLRPSAVISTGAAPGLLALGIGRLLGARTVWIDSIANAAELSLSGRLARRHANLWLTQWSELARDGGPAFEGAVL